MPRKILVGVLIVVATGLIGIVTAAQLWRAPNEALTPSGLPMNTSHYVAADGARIAVDLWLPADYSEEPLPTVVIGTRYWRATGLTVLGRVAAMFGANMPGLQPSTITAHFLGRGFAVLQVDARGTGASTGTHRTEYDPQEIADYTDVLDWVVAQPWSNGDVFATGVSYSGTHAELITTTQHPALKAVAPLYSDFDGQYQLVTPGGVPLSAFADLWGDMVAAMDRNDLCALMAAGQPEPPSWGECLMARWLVSGVKPVPGEWSTLRQAVESRPPTTVADTIHGLTARDSLWGDSGFTTADLQPFGRKAEIEASGVPMFVVAGWFDAATANGALARFQSFSNPQSVLIAPLSHGGEHDTDPFRPLAAPPVLEPAAVLDQVADFFEAHAQGARGTSYGLRYLPLGSEVWRTTQRWPPEAIVPTDFYLADDGALAESDPTQTGFDTLDVDEQTATSRLSRWATQVGGGDVDYRPSIRRGLTYTAAPLDAARELSGSVIVDVWMTSDTEDAALFMYLEAVSPQGEVRYLTEGILHLRHRANTTQPPYPSFGPTHSFLEADAQPMPLGRIERVTTTLFATSAVIPAGYRVRLRIEGADRASFATVPAPGVAPRFHIYRGPTKPSSVTLPLAAL